VLVLDYYYWRKGGRVKRRDCLKTLTIITSKLFLPPVEILLPTATQGVWNAVGPANFYRFTVGDDGQFACVLDMEAHLIAKWGSLNLVENNAMVEVICLPQKDTSGDWINGWTTGPDNYLRINGSSEQEIYYDSRGARHYAIECRVDDVGIRNCVVLQKEPASPRARFLKKDRHE
jgi:hypothetical protein